MSPGTLPTKLMTTEQMLELPENGVDRALIRGELREKPMTRRNRKHSRSMIHLGRFLDLWLETQVEPRGEIVGGDAGFVLRRDPDSSVGIDLAYVSAKVVANTPKSAAYFEGAPVLAVEILSPSDQQEDIDEKIDIYQGAGVSLIWIVNPRRQTVEVLRAGAEPELFNVNQVLTGEPHLPGFRVEVAEIFRS
jgi:Uma2 family endonuclease